MMKRAWIALILCLGSVPARAWDDNGHKVIARIAWDSMKPETRVEAIRLLKAAPRDSDLATPGHSDLELFLRAATWPDIVRDKTFQQRWEKYHHGKWHYTNWFWEPGPPLRDRTDLQPDPENIVKKLNDLQSSLADRTRSDADRAIDLAWVLHLVGDIHQPLHNSARVTPETPEGDQGGNLFKLTADESLHWYWDQILVRTYIRRPWEKTQEAYVEKIVREIRRHQPKPLLEPHLLPGLYKEWALAGLKASKEKVYVGVEPGRMPSNSYRKKAYQTVEPRMALAGYRLADFLDRALQP